MGFLLVLLGGFLVGFFGHSLFFFKLKQKLFMCSAQKVQQKGVTHFCTSKSLTAQPEGEPEARSYRATTLNKVTDGKITEACQKMNSHRKICNLICSGILRV